MSTAAHARLHKQVFVAKLHCDRHVSPPLVRGESGTGRRRKRRLFQEQTVAQILQEGGGAGAGAGMKACGSGGDFCTGTVESEGGGGGRWVAARAVEGGGRGREG